jgi:hypothetical protein
MNDSADTYFDAWNETDGAARREMFEHCLTGDVELIDENGRFPRIRGPQRSHGMPVSEHPSGTFGTAWAVRSPRVSLCHRLGS